MYKYAYNLGVVKVLDTLGITKTANPELAAQIASGADPTELQNVADSKLTEKDIEAAAKVVQVIAQMKQQADEAGLSSAGGSASGAQPSAGASGMPPMGGGASNAMPNAGMGGAGAQPGAQPGAGASAPMNGGAQPNTTLNY